MRVSDLGNFIYARENVRRAKEAGRPRPYTLDPILDQYRFCNMQREHDKVTLWITENWRTPLAELEREKLWFWMLVARFVNVPDTLAGMTEMALADEWDAGAFKAIMRSRLDRGEKAWGAAYTVSTNGHAMDKEVYIADMVLTPARSMAEGWDHYSEPNAGLTLAAVCEQLMTLNGISGFMAGQVIADAKYADTVLLQADDWHTFAISGPGSRRGLNRVMGHDKDARWKEKEWYTNLVELRERVNYYLPVEFGWDHQYHAQDIQNCLCEFDKYERVRLGEGTPRQRY